MSSDADKFGDGGTQITLSGEAETKVVNMKNARTWDVDIGRANGGTADMSNTKPTNPGWIGNPYRMSDGFSREEAVELFREHFIKKLRNNDEFRAAVDELEGKTLGGHCKPKACHGDVIVAYLRGELDV